jgi:GNAT superfamily N-acetyltransferase
LIELRTATDADRPFLLEVYASTRADELDRVDWDESTKQAFVEMQFAAQEEYYRRYHPQASFDVVLANGEPVGRLYVERWDDEIRIVDLALLPGARGRRIGTWLLGELIAEAEAAGKRLSVHVEVGNPARAFYERLGFEPAPLVDDGFVTHALLIRR